MKTKEIIIWFAVIAVLIGGLWLLINAANAPLTPPPPAEIQNVPSVSKTDLIRGNPNAKVTLIEYADFQCPACAVMHATIKQLQGDFKDNLRLVYRFFPLTNIHQNSLISAQAVYAAGLQGKFWEMFDMVYENQESWSDSTQPKTIFTDYAKKIGLNLNKFNSDMDSDLTKKFITDEQSQGLDLGINATPTIFMNGKEIQNPATYEEFKKLIQDEINKN
jgi:protein-disulfide isomerase